MFSLVRYDRLRFFNFLFFSLPVFVSNILIFLFL